MIYYNENQIKEIKTQQSKWILITAGVGVFALSLFLCLLFIATYESHLIEQILGALILGGYFIFLTYSIDAVFIENHIRQKHIVAMLTLNEEKYLGLIENIGSPKTISKRMIFIPITMKINGKTAIFYANEAFLNDFKKDDEVKLSVKNRYIYSAQKGAK